MNELENKIEQLEKYIEVKEQECDDLQDRIDFLIDRNDEKEDRIDKAIELLNQRKHCEKLFGGVEKSNTQIILDILQGDNK